MQSVIFKTYKGARFRCYFFLAYRFCLKILHFDIPAAIDASAVRNVPHHEVLL